MAITPIGRTIAPIKLDLINGANGAMPNGASALAGGATANSPTAASFGQAISGAVDHLNQLQNTADMYAQQAATGKLESIEDYLTTATEAQLSTQLTVAVRNKAVEAFQEIMRMQV
jgi:flagellar hook-basal body complex protein FliE